MDLEKRADSLQLENHGVFDNQVQIVRRPQPNSLVSQNCLPVHVERQPGLFQLELEALAVDVLEQAWPENAVHFDCAAGDRVRDRTSAEWIGEHDGAPEQGLIHVETNGGNG